MRAGAAPQLRLLHYVLSTFVRQHLERGARGGLAYNRAATNCLRFLGTLWQQPRLRSDVALQRVLLAPLMKPILTILQSVSTV